MKKTRSSAPAPDSQPNKRVVQSRQKRRASIADIWHRLSKGFVRLTDQLENLLRIILETPLLGDSITQGRLLHAVEKELEEQLMPLMRETIAHNFFLVHLSPADFAYYQQFKAHAEKELEQYLQQVTESGGYKLLGVLCVEMVESNDLLPDQYRIESHIEKDVTTPKKIFRAGSITQAQLARAVENELEDQLKRLTRETIAHNFFLVHLSPADFAYYQQFKVHAEEDLEQYLQQVTESRDYKLSGMLCVEVVESNDLLPGEYRIESRIEQDVTTQKSAWLKITNSGKSIPLDKDIITIGRNHKNDVCVGYQEGHKKVVSRRHAHIRKQGRRFVLYDRKSTQGTYINGRKLDSTQGYILQNGDRFCLGPTQKANHNQPQQGSVMIVFHKPNNSDSTNN